MRKSLFFTAIAALAAFASCQKEDLTDNYTVKDPVFTATIENSGTKTTVNAANGKVAWVSGDEITITDANSNSVKYEVSNIDAQGKATFTKQSGETKSLGAGPYTAVYGVAPTTSQTYSTTAPSLPMSASSQTTSLNFEVTCGLLEITLTKADETIKIIDVSDGTNTYTLVCPNVSIASATKFYLAVPKATYTSFIFTNQSNKTCVKSSLSIAVAANHIKPVSSTTLTFSVDKLRGEFSVDSEGKKVYFSPGNLWSDGGATTPTLKFETNQYDYSAIYDEVEEEWYWNPDHVCHFYWTNSVSEADDEEYTTYSGDDFFCSENNKLSVDGTPGWYTLSSDEWEYLLGRKDNQKSKYGYATVGGTSSDNGIHGIIILPDSFTDPKTNGGSNAFKPDLGEYSGTWSDNVYTSGGNWEAMESAGAVFLPAAGCRYFGTYVNYAGDDGYYWSSTPYGENYAYRLYFGSNFARVNSHDRDYGRSVRLVRNIE